MLMTLMLLLLLILLVELFLLVGVTKDLDTTPALTMSTLFVIPLIFL